MSSSRARWAPLMAVLTGQGVASATSFVTTLALGRFAGETTLGQFALGWSFWFFAMSIGDTMVATPYTYFVAQRRDISLDLAMCAAWGIALQCALLLLALAALGHGNVAGFASLWPALPAAIVASSAREFVRRHLLAVGRAPQVLRLDVVGSLIQLAGLALLVWAGRLTAVNTFWLIAGAAGLTVLPLCTRRGFDRLLAARRDAPKVLMALFGYGRWLLLGGICHVASVQAYPWLAYAAGGERLAGLFAASSALLNVLAPLLTGLTNYFRPKFMAAQTQLSDPDFARYVTRRTALFVAPAVLLWALVLVIGDALLAAIYGVAFREGGTALAWLGLGLISVALAAPVQLALLAMHAPVTNLYYHGVAVLLLALVSTVAGRLSLTGLGQTYCAVNAASTLTLIVLFTRRRNASGRTC